MSWTDSDTIKKHLLNLDQNLTAFRDVRVEIGATGSANLPHRGVVSESEKVKKQLQLAPVSESGVSLNGENWVQLDYSDLMPGEIVVAANSKLESIYHLDQDYCFDPSKGKIRRISGGSISDGASVEIAYRRYAAMTRNVDYSINYALGIITLIETGDLSPDTAVWVDYEISVASAVDDLLPEAIIEAEDKILNLLKSGYDQQSTEQGLITGATELSLAVICRGLALRALADGLTSAENRSRGWREMANRYEAQGWRTLRPFVKSPMVTGGSKQSNTNWEWN